MISVAVPRRRPTSVLECLVVYYLNLVGTATSRGARNLKAAAARPRG